MRRIVAFYRLQAHLLWEWRPTRLAIARRIVLSFLVACLALAITAYVLAGLTIDGVPALLLGGALVLALNGTTELLFEWLLVPLPLIVAQGAGVAVQVVALLALGRFVPGIHVDGLMTAVVGAVVLTVLNGFLAELVAVSDDDSYYSALVRRLTARTREGPGGTVPGLLVVQVDGLSLPVLQNALRAGRVPVLGLMLRNGDVTVGPWVPMLPPTTPASQAGILHGRNDGVVGFRWYEKALDRVFVANHPDDAAEIVRRISDGNGLLAHDGASIGNLVTGDAARSYLTMATITKPVSDDAHRLRGFYVSTVNYVRLVILMLGEVGKELYQAERQRGRVVLPRMHRDFHYALERAITNTALRTISTALVIEEMFDATPVIYVDYVGYDAVAHHAGPERQESIDALEGIDRAIGSLDKARRHTPREYRLVVLSDHGQSLGATFSQRYGQPLEHLLGTLMPDGSTIVGTAEPVEQAGMARRMVAEIGRGTGVAPLVVRHLPRRRIGVASARTSGRGSSPSPDQPSLPDAVVMASGNLAHIYFNIRPDQMTRDEIEACYPGLIEGLMAHPGVGAMVVREADGRIVALSPTGAHDVIAGRSKGKDPLATFGPGAAAAIGRLAGFDNAGDLILLGTFDHASGEVTGFEELVGSHGGLGGWQTEPFILYPKELQLDEEPLVGAPALYHQLQKWLAAPRPAGASHQGREPDGTGDAAG